MQRIQQCVEWHEGQLVGAFEDVVIRSTFQPIYSLVHSKMVGVEALMRCTDSCGVSVSPLSVLTRPERDEEQDVFLDRLCRYLHVHNYAAHVSHSHWLFMNVSARTVIAGRRYGSYFSELLSQMNLSGHRIVVEILEDGIADERQLSNAIDYYRDLGCIIAIDDFGAGSSNFNRVWEINPDIVKLDRSLVVRATADIHTRRALPSLVELLRESGCLVLMEGVETEAEAVIAVRSGVDMVQGYYFAEPSLTAQPTSPIPELMRHVQSKFIEATRDVAVELGNSMKPHVELFQQAANQMRHGESFASATAEFLAAPLVSRCYLLDQDGMQQGESIVAPSLRPASKRFEVLMNGAGADWSTRSYYRKAVQNPEQIQITKPYLSITDADTCVTLSIAISFGSGVKVLCGDMQLFSI